MLMKSSWVRNSGLGIGDPNTYELGWSQVQMSAEVDFFNHNIGVR